MVIEGEDWVEVRRRHLRNWVPMWDSFPVGKKHSGKVSSFYIVEFSNIVNASDLFGLFGCIENVVEVSIAPRNNKRGKLTPRI